MNRKIRKCPYCKSNVSYFAALSELNSGEHTCPVCNKNSNISYEKKIYIPAAVLLVLSLIFAAMFFVFKVITNLMVALVLILIPFGVFYFLTPLFFKLDIINSEAQTPVVRYEPKRAARAEKQSRVLKSDESAKVEAAKKEQKSTKKKNSGESKFAKFIKTYVIVDDDDENTDNQNSNADSQKLENKNIDDNANSASEKKSDDSQIIIDEVTEIKDEPFAELEIEELVPVEKPKAEEKKESKSQELKNKLAEVKKSVSPEKNVPEQNKNAEDKDKDEKKPKLNFGTLFSKLNFSEDKSDTPPAVPEVSNKTETSVPTKDGITYHRLTKTDKVDFIYHYDKKAFISVNSNIFDNKEEDIHIDTDDAVEVVDFETNSENDERLSNDIPETIGIVVEKALEAENDDEENREILNFFAAAPTPLEEAEFGEKPVEQTTEEVTEKPVEQITEEPIEEKSEQFAEFVESTQNVESTVHNQISEPEDEDWIEYLPESGEYITVDLSKKTNRSNDDNIISLSDVNFDIFGGENNEPENEFIEYEAENKLPVIVVEDSKKEDNSKTDDDISEKNHHHKDSAFSSYVSKIKKESVFNLEKLAKSVDRVLNDEAALAAPTETPTDILHFSEDIPEESNSSEIIRFTEELDTELSEKNSSGEYPEIISQGDDAFPSEIDINAIMSETDNELIRNVTEFDGDSISATNIVSQLLDAQNGIPEINAENNSSDEIITEPEKTSNLTLDKIESEIDLEYSAVVEEVENSELASLDFSEKDYTAQQNISDDNEELNQPDDEPISEKDEEYYRFEEEDEQEVTAEDEPISEKDDEYYHFEEEDEQEVTAEDEPISEKDEEYYRFEEEDEQEVTAEDEPISEKDEEYYRFEEEYEQEATSEDEPISEKDEEYYRFEEEDDEEESSEAVEGAIEFIPEENDEESFVVDYSGDKDQFEDISSGEQLDKNFDLEKYRSEGKIDDTPKKPVVPVKIDSRGNRIDEPKKQSRYEKKFPNAAKAAAEEAAALELKKQRELQKAQAKKKKAELEAAKTEQQKPTAQKKKSKKPQEPKPGFFTGIKNKIMEATEEERQAAFEEEERERKLAEKEARRKAKEKEKEKAEKQKASAEKAQIKSSAGVSTAKDGYEKLERQSAEERKKLSQKTKRIEKSKVKIPADIPADGNTIIFDSSKKSVGKEYDAQEKIVLDSVKDKVKQMEEKKLTEADKVKIITEKVDEEKRREKVEQLKNEQEQQRIRKEKQRKENQLRNERLEKAEEIRRQQVSQVRREQEERNKSEEKRDTSNVSLKEVGSVRSKVSQKKKKRKKAADEVV